MGSIQIAAWGAAWFCFGIAFTVRLAAWMSARLHRDPTEQWLFRLATLAPFALALACSLFAVMAAG